MFVDHRTYTLHPLKLGKWLTLYKSMACLFSFAISAT